MITILLFAVGIVTGAMNSIAGGGMLLGFPVLLAAGVPVLNANATTNIIVLPGQMASAFGYRKHLRKLPPQYLVLLVPCMIGAAIGAYVLKHTSNEDFQHLVPGLILLAVLLFAFQPYLHSRLHRHIRSRNKDGRTLALICLALLPLSVYGGYFGAGFGFIMLAFLGFTQLHIIHQINGLKNLVAVGIAIVSIAVLSGAHLIDWRHGLVMAAGNLIGGYAGALLAQKIPSHTIRVVVIAIGICTALYLAFRNY